MSLSLILFITRVNSKLKGAKKNYKSNALKYMKLSKELSDMLSVKNKFIATVTHEIRNIASK